MIVIVAPYSPPGRSANPHLGAARKIESVINIMSRFGPPIILVNTAHEDEISSPLRCEDTIIAGISITEIFPPTYRSRRFGKLRNIFDVRSVSDAILSLGSPQLTWLYNGYAMESRIGVDLKNRTGCHIIQEMEDWHFSRRRGWNPKPFIDWYFWRKAARQASHIFSVNANLAEKLRRLNSNISLFPGVVNDTISAIRNCHPPFSADDKKIYIGYFGGLSSEKGADHILALRSSLPEKFKFIVTGAGPLENEFVNASLQDPDRFNFQGQVDDETLASLIARCDILLNPHSPINEMANGVFPFKVIESIASGRVLVSTPLPNEGLESVLQGVIITKHDNESFTQGVINAHQWYQTSEKKVRAGADEAVKRFGISAISTVVQRVHFMKADDEASSRYSQH